MSKKVILIFCILVFYIIFIAYSDFEKFSLNITKFNFSLLPVIIVLTISSMIIKGLRQQIFLKKLNINIPIKNCIMLYFAGMSLIATPGGVGQFIKSYYLKKIYGYAISNTYPIVLIERLLDIISVGSVLLFVTILQGNQKIIFVEIIFVSLFVSLLIISKNNKMFTILLKVLNKIPVLKKQAVGISKSQNVFKSLISLGTISKAVVIGMVAWILDAVMIYLIFVGFGMNFSIIFTTFISYVSLLLGAISLLPAGIGVTEVSYLGLLVRNGVDTSVAASLVFIIRMISVWLPTSIGAITTKLYMKKTEFEDNSN